MKKNILSFLFILLSSSLVLAQTTRTISGVITSADDKLSIPGATVIIEGTSKGVAADFDGKFTLQIPDNIANPVLVVSFIGMKTQRIEVGTQTSISIVMATESIGLEEVVIAVPYISQKKETFTGSVGVLKSEQLSQSNAESVDKMLQGNVAGVVASNASGQPGGETQVRIRGIGSMNAGSSPLYVIDGVPVTTANLTQGSTETNAPASTLTVLSSLNPKDIESISILKDAAATSLYGSRASNGVIMITTKRGKEGKTRYTFSTNQGISTRTNSNFKLLNASQFVELQKEAYHNAGYSDQEMKSKIGSDSVSTDWMKQVYGTGHEQNYDFSAAGGSEKTSFFVSGAYKKQQGIVIGTSLERLSARLNLEHKANDILSFGAKSNISNTSQATTRDPSDRGSVVQAAYVVAPNQAIMIKDEYNFGNHNFYNPVGLNALNTNTVTNMRMSGNAWCEVKPTKKLKIKSINNVDYINLNQYRYSNSKTPDGYAFGGVGSQYNTRDINWVSSNTATYDTRIDSIHNLTVIVGGEAQKNETNYSGSSGIGFADNTLSLSSATTALSTTASRTSWAIASAISSLQYNVLDRYYASASLRRDGSSRFSPDNRWANFWSLGFSWRISNESFLKDNKLVKSLKLRASYGTSGNADIGNYTWMALYDYGYNYNNNPGGIPSQIGNSKLTWEKNRNADIGVDYRLGNRVYGGIEFYYRTTYDLLQRVPISQTNGYEYQMQNAGEMVNKGVEVSLGCEIVKAKDVQWQIDAQCAHNKNEITKLYGGNDIIDGALIHREGEAFNTFYLAQWAGVNSSNGAPMWYDEKGNITYDYSLAARKISGTADPLFTAGLTNTFTYKGLSLAVQFYTCYGNKIYNNINRVLLADGYNTDNNQVVEALSRWQKPGDITSVPKIIAGNPTNSNASSTRYLEDGSFIRLKNITLAYLFGDKITKSLHIASLRVYAQASNLYTWTNYSGIDPEQNIRGVAWFTYPNARTISGGIEIGF